MLGVFDGVSDGQNTAYPMLVMNGIMKRSIMRG